MRRRFLKGLTIYGRGGQLSHVTKNPRTNFSSAYPFGRHTKFDLWMTDGRRQAPEHGYTISGELKEETDEKNAINQVIKDHISL